MCDRNRIKSSRRTKLTVGRTICSLLIVYLVTSKVNAEDLDKTSHYAITERELEDNLIDPNKSIENSTTFETTTAPSGSHLENTTTKTYKEEPLGMDSLTIIWYLTTFIALLGFFIVMACTENSCARRQSRKPAENNLKPPSPCPSYKNFAPPSYDTVMKKYKNPRVFIVPVHENNSFFNQTSPTSSPTSLTIPQREINSNQPKPNSISVDVEKGEISV